MRISGVFLRAMRLIVSMTVLIVFPAQKSHASEAKTRRALAATAMVERAEWSRVGGERAPVSNTSSMTSSLSSALTVSMRRFKPETCARRAASEWTQRESGWPRLTHVDGALSVARADAGVRLGLDGAVLRPVALPTRLSVSGSRTAAGEPRPTDP